MVLHYYFIYLLLLLLLLLLLVLLLLLYYYFSVEAKHEPRASDMQCYNNLLSGLPQENITVPLILHAMAEQVCENFFL